MSGKRKLKKYLPKVLIGLGAAMVLTFAIYEGVTYPWRTLFASWGWVTIDNDPDSLPDPAPLPDSAQLVGLEDLDAKPSTDEDIPGQPNFFASRPPMEITWLGSIKIPRIQLSENVVEGTGDELLYGVGHAGSTAMPGQEGNCVLAGHRNYIVMKPFRYLDKVQAGDLVYLTDTDNVYAYEVFEIFEIEPDENWVMGPQEGETHLLTLVTCTPVLTYTNRLIVRGRLIETTPLW